MSATSETVARGSWLRSLGFFRPRSASESQQLTPAAITAISLLQQIQGGSLCLCLPNGDTQLLGHGEVRATLEVADLRVFDRALGEGDIGFAESYIAGDWQCDKLGELLTLLAENRDVLARAVHGQWFSVLKHRLRHLARANTRRGSKQNILAHYDLGNDFYRLWLDPSMTYSSALFGQSSHSHAADDVPHSLEQAQQAKYLRILDRLAPKPGDTILEIGCGWGGFAEMAVTRYGCRVHGITLSPSQLAYAQARAARGGWADNAHFELIDYRDVTGQFDHIVSIEMLEAVGERYWPRYFRQVKKCLKPGGRAVIQSITIANERFSAYRRGTDFIQRHIFPGGMLPSPKIFERRATAADFSVTDRLAFGLDYARTLATWHESFDTAWPEIAAQGFDEQFRRLWKFYLAYCEGGFRSAATDVYQFTLQHRQ